MVAAVLPKAGIWRLLEDVSNPKVPVLSILDLGIVGGEGCWATGYVLHLFGQDPAVRCPRCQSQDTCLVSQFGSTACKAAYQCSDCQEPFDYFKCP